MSKIKTAKDAAASAARKSSRSGAKGKKHVFVLMDESGSMHGLEEAVTTGCNEFLHAFKSDEQARIWLAWFDYTPGEDRTRFKVKGKRASKIEPLTPADYAPRGTTPLNDSIADAVAALDSVTNEEDTVFLAVITDGMENASERSTATIKQLLEQREEAGWAVVFIGANQDSVQTARAFGMHKPGAAFDFDANPQSMRASMRTMSTVANMRFEFGAGKPGKDRYDALVAEEHTRRGGRADVED